MFVFPRALNVGALALMLALACPSLVIAQDWNFQVTAPGPHGALPALTRVSLSPTDLLLAYSVHENDRDLSLISCRARVGDVGDVKTVANNSGSFLLVYLKPGRTATCNDGGQTIATVPVASESAARPAVATIVQACCRATSVAAAPRATAAPNAASLEPEAWTQTDGVFAFLRIRNRDAHPVVIANGEILNCRNVVSGCNSFASPSVTIAPGAVVTIATIVSNSPQGGAFSYRYDAGSGPRHVQESGTSSHRPSEANAPMSPDEIRAAEATAVAHLAGPHGSAPAAGPSAAPSYVAPRLTQRGSSRLAVGKQGMAMLRVQVGMSGMAEGATILSISNRDLSAAAIETAVSSHYAPATRDGRPTAADYIATFRFDGSDPALAGIPAWKRTPEPSPSP